LDSSGPFVIGNASGAKNIEWKRNVNEEEKFRLRMEEGK